MSFWDDFFGANGDPMQGFSNNEFQFANEYNPWVNAGQGANNFLYDEDKNLVNNRNGPQDQIAKGFYTSPYQSNLLNMTQNRMNMNAANTGMLGSTASNLYQQNQLNNMTGQFQNDYINNGLQSFGMGMNGLQGIDQMGLNALNQKTGLQEQGAIGQMAAQQQQNKFWPNAIGQVGGFLANGGKSLFNSPGMQSQPSGQSPQYGGGAGASQGWGGVPMMPPSGGFNSMFGGGSTFDLGSLAAMGGMM